MNTDMHINIARPDLFACRRDYCPTCKHPVYAIGWHEPWYGWTVTCLGCGDMWQDGERVSRPFERGWRRQRIEGAKRFWRLHHKNEQREE